jgi:hypothetical protein
VDARHLQLEWADSGILPESQVPLSQSLEPYHGEVANFTGSSTLTALYVEAESHTCIRVPDLAVNGKSWLE